jgi:hypothetical protein
MACCVHESEQFPAPPVTPVHGGSQDQEQVVALFSDATALLSECDAIALLRASSVAGNGYLAVITLQSQSVRIQT